MNWNEKIGDFDVRAYYNDNKKLLLWLHNGDHIIGQLKLDSPNDKAEYMYIEGASILKEYRSRGLYQALLQMATKFAKDLGFKGIQSDSHSRSNAADKAWEKVPNKREVLGSYVIESKEARINKLLKEAFLTKEHLHELAEPFKQNMTEAGLDGIVTLDSTHSKDIPLKSAVTVILNDKGEILMGTSASDDSRFGKLCFVGGGIDEGETCSQAAVREASEEAGLTVHPRLMNPYTTGNVAFVVCDYVDGDINHNNEFTDMNWYGTEALPENMFEPNVKYLNFIKQELFN